MGQPRKGAAPLEKVTARFKTESGKAWDEWEVLEMDVLERIGEPTDGKLVIAATTNRFDFQPLLGKSCVLILSRGANRKRCFKGIVYQIEHRGEYPFGSVARINFASAVAALQHGQDSRVWEERTAPQIIEEVFKEALEPFGREVRLKLSRTYAVREYCVQYKESDWSFVKRLMVDEGISFFLDESGKETDREVLVLVDNNDAFPELETMGDELEAPPAPMPPPVQSSTWIEARVVWDQGGEPVADLPVVIEPPGGSRTMRSTSSDGLVRLDPIDPGPCEARCSFAGLKVSECVEFAGMGEERSPRSPGVGAGAAPQSGERPQAIVRVARRRVRAGDTIESIAKEAGLKAEELAYFNWGTKDPKEIDDRLEEEVGCTRRSADCRNYRFDDSDLPGIVLVPRRWRQPNLASTRRHVIRVKPIEPASAASLVSRKLAIEDGAFSKGSSFPGPGCFPFLEAIAEALREAPGARVAIIGHAEAQGGTEEEKRLSEGRAKAIRALLARDVDLFEEVAEEEGWDTAEYQAMLRGLGCNPGAIDGVAAELTREAVRRFQEEYNDGLFGCAGEDGAATGDESASQADLAVDGVLSRETRAAIREAYLALSPAGRDALDASRLIDVCIGCGALNPCDSEEGKAGRVEVALMAGPRPVAEDFPCKVGDASGCDQSKAEPTRCRFYRRFFRRDREPVEAPPFWDFQWLSEDRGTVHLSAATRLPEGTSARFHICRWTAELPETMPDSRQDERPEGLEAIAEIQGEIRGGIAYARWEPPEDFDLFDASQWLVDRREPTRAFEEEEARGAELEEEARIHPPVFVIEAGGEWAFSEPPGRAPRRSRARALLGGRRTAIDTAGRLWLHSSSGEDLVVEQGLERSPSARFIGHAGEAHALEGEETDGAAEGEA